MSGILAVALSVVPLASGVDPAAAARAGDDRAVHSKKKAAHADHGPILAVVSLARQRIWVYGRDGLMGQSAVSTGVPEHRTPTGVFSVIQKNRFHRSNIYSNAPMPYMQRITWSGVALHAGIVPGYPASHGCIRLPNQFAAELWGMTRIGARVIVAPDEAAVSEVAHARLPVPLLAPLPWERDELEEKASPRADAPDRADASEKGEADVVGVGLKEDERDEAASSASRLLDPQARAKAIMARTTTDAAAKAKAAKAAAVASAARAAEANKAMAALRAAHLVLAAARGKHDAATRAMEKATSPQAIERAQALVTDAERRIADAEKAAEEAHAVEAVKTPEAMAAAKAAWVAEQASKEAAAALKVAERSVQPISIFISKKTARVYVRQAWAPIHEAPVEFKDAAMPIGTHAYLATSPDPDGKGLRWLSASLPPSPPKSMTRQEARNGSAPERSVSEPAAPSHYPRETAATVLNRFELPEGTRRFIEERLWTGASLIVSDEGISTETGTYTDFIVLTR